tara:strand:- start:51 stop:350 length:300 start_codon:yes stop_codon:yes gene_type:complete
MAYIHNLLSQENHMSDKQQETTAQKVVKTENGLYYFAGSSTGFSPGQVIDMPGNSAENYVLGDILALQILQDLGYTIQDQDTPDNPSDIGEYIKAVYGK